MSDSVIADLRLSPDAAMVLERGVLYEDDGPAAGFTYQPSVEMLTSGVRLRKQLILDEPAAESATLLAAPGGTLNCSINGKPAPLGEPRRCGDRWQAYDIPPALFQRGKNEIVLWGEGSVWIARAEDYPAGSRDRVEHPDRSARSIDGGETWDSQRLGARGDEDGEYCVRLFLDHFRPQGTATLAVQDVANTDGGTVGPPADPPGAVRIEVEGHAPKGTGIKVRMRSGTTPIPDEEQWSEWKQLGDDGRLDRPAGRFLQVALDLSTRDPRHTPRVMGVRIEAEAKLLRDWTDRIEVLEDDNPRIVRSSIPFRYEKFDEPALRTLRREYRLDDIAAGAGDEWTLIQRLAAWSAERWEGIAHLSGSYPPWNALEILGTHSDGTPVGGFCLQHNLVLLQACESFGIPGRVVSMGPGTVERTSRGGHEAIEVWSNIHRKWVYVDGQFAWFCRDAESDVPLSLWQLRDRQLAAMDDPASRPVEVVHIGAPRREWGGLSDWPPFIELRMIPRSNFLGESAPLPLNQGMRGWFWTGHCVWSDTRMPAREIYDNRVGVESNWRWTLNQAHAVVEATSRPGIVRVHLDTETPGFETFIAQIDDSDAKPVQSGFQWELRDGVNELAAWPRNNAGRDGIPCRLKLRYGQESIPRDPAES